MNAALLKSHLDFDHKILPIRYIPLSGAGQSNLSTEVAALIQSEMASQSRQRLEQRLQQPNLQQPRQQQRPESPDMDFLEMDFDPGEDDESDKEASEDEQSCQNETPELILNQARPQELHLEVIEKQQQEEAAGLENHLGNVSAPLQSPASVMELCSNMTRSRSLNSPLGNFFNLLIFFDAEISY